MRSSCCRCAHFRSHTPTLLQHDSVAFGVEQADSKYIVCSQIGAGLAGFASGGTGPWRGHRSLSPSPRPPKHTAWWSCPADRPGPLCRRPPVVECFPCAKMSTPRAPRLFNKSSDKVLLIDHHKHVAGFANLGFIRHRTGGR